MAKKIVHTIKKITGWLLICLLAGLLGAGIFAWLKVPGYLGENLSEWIDKKSGGTYKLQFDDFKLSILKRGLTFRNIKLQPVDSLISRPDSAQKQKTYYAFSSPELNIRNIGLVSLFVMKKLVIGRIDIHTPDFRVGGDPLNGKMPARNFELLLKEFEPLLREKLHSVRIKKIELIDANYAGGTETGADAGHITIGIKNFYTDSVLLADPGRIFDAEDVFIRMTDYRNRLKDSLHVLTAGELYYSLKKGRITGKNVLLQPADSTQELRNKYMVKVPYLKLVSKNIQGYFTSDSLHIDSLFLDKPEINFYPRQKSTEITLEHISNFDLYELISNSFKNVSISHFMLNGAHLKLFNFRNGYFLQQEMKKMNLELANFYLDSAAVGNTAKIFYSDKLNLTVNNYKINLGDNNHQLDIDKLTASTDGRFVRIYRARVRPISEVDIKKSRKVAIRVDCDSIMISEADLKQAYHSRRLPIGSVELYRPVTVINRYDRRQEKIKKSPSLVYQMISNYFLAIYANLITMENGKLEVNDLPDGRQNGYIQSGIDFQLTDFALDSISASKSDKLFFATNIDLVFSNYEMKLLDQIHRMTIGKIDISSTKRRAVVEQFHLFPVTHDNPEEILKKFGNSELYDVKVPYLYFLNTDIHQAFFNKKLTIGNIRIVEPEISYESFASLKTKNENGQGIDEFYRLLSNYISDVDISEIRAEDGELKLTNHDRKGKTIGFDNKFDLLLEKFRLNKDEIGKRKLLFSENIDLKIKKYLFRLSDRIHYLQAGEIGFSTFGSQVYMKNAILYPDITNPAYKKLPLNIYITVPWVSFSGVDLISLYYDGKLIAKNFNISKPDIKLYKVNDNKKKTDFKDFIILLPEELKSLEINDFRLDDGELQLFREIGAEHKKYMGGSIAMQAGDLKIENKSAGKKSPEISGLFTTRLKNFWFEPIGINQKINIGSIDYSTNSKKISIKNLLIAPQTADASKNQFKMLVPDLQLHSFDIDLAYTKNQYIFDQIILLNPDFTFYRNVQNQERFNPYTVDLYPYFEDFADVFSTKRLTIENAFFQLHTKEKIIRQKGINLSLSGFRVDKNKDRRFLYSDQFAFSFNNVERFDRERMYKFRFDQLGFSSSDKHFVIRGIHLEPQYEAEKYSQMIGHQSDYFKGDLDEIRFEDLDLERWFEKEELVGKRIRINGLNLDVYRDKRLPFNEKQRPLMPQNLLRTFDLKFYFDSLELNNSDISYSEQVEESPEAGTVSFKNVHARLKPFTNIPYLINVSGRTQLDATANLMGGPVITANVNLDMASPANSFEVTGNVAPFPMNILNPMTKPAAFVEINTGELDKFEFQFTGDNEQAKGKLKFAYNDLNISILEMKDGSAKKSRFSSFLANSLMLKSKNPRGKILLPEDINYRRDPSRSILNYWWKSIFDGVKGTFGFKDKTEE